MENEDIKNTDFSGTFHEKDSHDINDIVKEINTSLRSKNYDETAIKLNTFKTIFDVLGINLFVEKMNDEQLDAYSKWMEARNNKDFETADIYRNKLIEWKIL